MKLGPLIKANNTD